MRTRAYLHARLLANCLESDSTTHIYVAHPGIPSPTPIHLTKVGTRKLQATGKDELCAGYGAFVPLLLDRGQDRSRITSYRLLVQMSEKSAPRRYVGSSWTTRPSYRAALSPLSECNKTRFVRIRNGGIAQVSTATLIRFPP